MPLRERKVVAANLVGQVLMNCTTVIVVDNRASAKVSVPNNRAKTQAVGDVRSLSPSRLSAVFACKSRVVDNVIARVDGASVDLADNFRLSFDLHDLEIWVFDFERFDGPLSSQLGLTPTCENRIYKQSA